MIKKGREKQIQSISTNVTVDHNNEVFFADKAVVSHNPNKFLIDFSQSVPRFDQVADKMHQTIVTKHNTIILDPGVIKSLAYVINENIKKYESSFGKIPFQKENEKKVDTLKQSKKDALRYIG